MELALAQPNDQHADLSGRNAARPHHNVRTNVDSRLARQAGQYNCPPSDDQLRPIAGRADSTTTSLRREVQVPERAEVSGDSGANLAPECGVEARPVEVPAGRIDERVALRRAHEEEDSCRRSRDC